MLTGSTDDPSMAGARNLDWEEFLECHDYRFGAIAGNLETGKSMVDAPKTCGLGYGHMRVVKGGWQKISGSSWGMTPSRTP